MKRFTMMELVGFSWLSRAAERSLLADRLSSLRCLVMVVIVVGLSGGCDSSSTLPLGPSAEGKRFLLAEEPQGAEAIQTVLEHLGGTATDEAVAATEEPAAPEGSASARTLVGMIPPDIDGVSHWDAKQAIFAIVDVEAQAAAQQHAETAGHDAESCPFCKRRQAQMATAIVHIVDDQGQTVQQDARTLLGLQEDQVVVVSGKTRRDELGGLQVAAQGIYIRKK